MNFLFAKNNLFVIDFCYYVHFIENIMDLGKCSAQKSKELYKQLLTSLIQYSITRFFLLRVPYGNQR